MRLKTGMLVGAMALGAAGNLAAQQGVAFTPFIGYLSPSGNIVEPAPIGGLQLKTKGGVQVGAIGEVSLAKQLGFGLFAASTVGLTQKASFDFFGGGAVIDQGMATTQLGGTLIFRPLGRNPNGSPKVFFLEAGAALNVLSFSTIRDRTDSTKVDSWNQTTGVGIVGGGFTFRVGPRATLVLFGRYHLPFSAYASPGLTAWNLAGCGPSPAANCPDIGKKVPTLFIGAGLRTGR